MLDEIERCYNCQEPLNEARQCINIDCRVAQEQATAGAARDTAKATASAAPNQPRAFTSGGRVD